MRGVLVLNKTVRTRFHGASMNLNGIVKTANTLYFESFGVMYLWLGVSVALIMAGVWFPIPTTEEVRIGFFVALLASVIKQVVHRFRP